MKDTTLEPGGPYFIRPARCQWYLPCKGIKQSIVAFIINRSPKAGVNRAVLELKHQYYIYAKMIKSGMGKIADQDKSSKDYSPPQH